MTERPPAVSILFFLAVAAMCVWGIVSQSGGSHGGGAHGGDAHGEDAHGDKADHGADGGHSALRRPQEQASAALAPTSFQVRFSALHGDARTPAATEAAYDPNDAYGGLPGAEDDLGRELTAAYCGACHSLQIVMQQNASPARWSELLTWMREKQGMAELPSDDYQAVYGYLTTHFGA